LPGEQFASDCSIRQPVVDVEHSPEKSAKGPRVRRFVRAKRTGERPISAIPRPSPEFLSVAQYLGSLWHYGRSRGLVSPLRAEETGHWYGRKCTEDDRAGYADLKNRRKPTLRRRRVDALLSANRTSEIIRFPRTRFALMSRSRADWAGFLRERTLEHIGVQLQNLRPSAFYNGP
jgi:hypothetical protein